MIKSYLDEYEGTELLQWLQQPEQQLLTALPLEGEVSANYASILARFLQQQKDISPKPLLEKLALSSSILADETAKIPVKQYADFVTQTILATNNPAIGIEYGARLNISTHGLLGYAVMSCPDLKKAIELARKFIKIRNQLIHISYEVEDNNELKIGFDLVKSNRALYQFEIDASLSSLYLILKDLFGSTQGIIGIHFSYPKPKDISVYKATFDVPILFDQALSCIHFNPSDFKQVSRITDATVSLVAEQQCEKLLEQLSIKDQGLGNQVRQMLLQSPSSFLSQEQVAEILNIAPRTLARRLAKEGVTFKQIVEDMRQKLALKCIENTQWSIEEIAHILKYSDAANFSRAFKRWTGASPGHYRKNLVVVTADLN